MILFKPFGYTEMNNNLQKLIAKWDNEHFEAVYEENNEN